MNNVQTFSVGDSDKDVIESVKKGKVAVMFSAAWCAPCKKIYPTFAKLAEETPDTVFEKINVDMFQGAARHFDITAMPTFMFFKDGKCIETIVGGSTTALVAAVEHLSQTKQEEAMQQDSSLLNKYTLKQQ